MGMPFRRCLLYGWSWIINCWIKTIYNFLRYFWKLWIYTGISFLSYENGGYDYSDDNVLTNDDDYDVDSFEINNKLKINIGFGYKF